MKAVVIVFCLFFSYQYCLTGAVHASGRNIKGDFGWAFLDKLGNVTPFPGFYWVHPFSEGRAPVKVGGRWGFANRHGALAVAPEFGEVQAFRQGLAAVKSGGKWGFIDGSGNKVIKPAFDWAHSFSEGLAVVVLDGLWGYVDKGGRLSLNLSSSQQSPFQRLLPWWIPTARKDI